MSQPLSGSGLEVPRVSSHPLPPSCLGEGLSLWSPSSPELPLRGPLSPVSVVPSRGLPVPVMTPPSVSLAPPYLLCPSPQSRPYPVRLRLPSQPYSPVSVSSMYPTPRSRLPNPTLPPGSISPVPVQTLRVRLANVPYPLVPVSRVPTLPRPDPSSQSPPYPVQVRLPSPFLTPSGSVFPVPTLPLGPSPNPGPTPSCSSPQSRSYPPVFFDTLGIQPWTESGPSVPPEEPPPRHTRLETSFSTHPYSPSPVITVPLPYASPDSTPIPPYLVTSLSYSQSSTLESPPTPD